MNFLGGSLRIGSLFGINIRVHILFLLWIAFRLLTARDNVATEALFLGLLFGIVLLHEFGHCLGARAVGGYAENILMWPLGGLAYAHAPMRPWPQFVTVACGPLVNVTLCVLSAAAILIASGGRILPGINPLSPGLIMLGDGPASVPYWISHAFVFYHVNLWLLAFNLLPIYPLDGGQLFHAIIWPAVGLRRATIIACQVGLVGCVILGLLALRGGGILFFIAIFGGLTCWQRLQAARFGLLIEDTSFTPSYPRGGFWSRIFGRRPRAAAPVRPAPPPREPIETPDDDEEAELDRLLKKVSQNGIQSLSYVDRQKLEMITRRRQRRERQFQGGGHP